MGMCAAAGKTMRNFSGGGEIDPEMQRRIAENQARFNPPPKPSLFSGLFGGSTPKPAAPSAQPPQSQGLASAIPNRNEELRKAAAYANGGKIKGPGTPTSDSIPAEVKQTGEPIKVSTGERIVSKAQDMLLQKIAQGLGFESLDAMLESGTGKPVGPTMKGGMAHAAFGGSADDIIRDGNSFSQRASPASAPMTDVNQYGNSMARTNTMRDNPTAFSPREPGMAGTNLYANGAGTTTGLSGAVHMTSTNASTITPGDVGTGAQPEPRQGVAPAPVSTGSADLDTMGTVQGSAPQFAIKSFSDIAKEQGTGNMAYRPGGIGDPLASGLPAQRAPAPTSRSQRRQAASLMTPLDEMFPRRFADGGKLNKPWWQGEDVPQLTAEGSAANRSTIESKPGYQDAPRPVIDIGGLVGRAVSGEFSGKGGLPIAQAFQDPAQTKQATAYPQASYSNEGRSVRALPVTNKDYQDAEKPLADPGGFVGQHVTDSGAAAGRSNVDATKLQAPNGGGFITGANGRAMLLPPQAIAARDPDGQYDANGNNMARTNQMKAELAGMERDRLIRDMGADITSPGTRYAAQQQIAQLDKGQGLAMQADKSQRNNVTEALEQQGKRQAMEQSAATESLRQRVIAGDPQAVGQWNRLNDKGERFSAADGGTTIDPASGLAIKLPPIIFSERTGKPANGGQQNIQSLPSPKTEAEMKKLPQGSRYTAPDGTTRVKP